MQVPVYGQEEKESSVIHCSTQLMIFSCRYCCCAVVLLRKPIEAMVKRFLYARSDWEAASVSRNLASKAAVVHFLSLFLLLHHNHHDHRPSLLSHFSSASLTFGKFISTVPFRHFHAIPFKSLTIVRTHMPLIDVLSLGRTPSRH